MVAASFGGRWRVHTNDSSSSEIFNQYELARLLQWLPIAIISTISQQSVGEKTFENINGHSSKLIVVLWTLRFPNHVQQHTVAWSPLSINMKLRWDHLSA
jgi:hypothetical protein